MTSLNKWIVSLVLGLYSILIFEEIIFRQECIGMQDLINLYYITLCPEKNISKIYYIFDLVPRNKNYITVKSQKKVDISFNIRRSLVLLKFCCNWIMTNYYGNKCNIIFKDPGPDSKMQVRSLWLKLKYTSGVVFHAKDYFLDADRKRSNKTWNMFKKHLGSIK